MRAFRVRAADPARELLYHDRDVLIQHIRDDLVGLRISAIEEVELTPGLDICREIAGEIVSIAMALDERIGQCTACDFVDRFYHTPLPRNYAEWQEAKRRATEQRRGRRKQPGTPAQRS